MRVDIWSDLVCPWCYVGKRRFERALASFPQRDEVEVVHRAYLLYAASSARRDLRPARHADDEVPTDPGPGRRHERGHGTDGSRRRPRLSPAGRRHGQYLRRPPAGVSGSRSRPPGRRARAPLSRVLHRAAVDLRATRRWSSSASRRDSTATRWRACSARMRMGRRSKPTSSRPGRLASTACRSSCSMAATPCRARRQLTSSHRLFLAFLQVFPDERALRDDASSFAAGNLETLCGQPAGDSPSPQRHSGTSVCTNTISSGFRT